MQFLYSVKPKGTILVWKYVRDFNNPVHKVYVKVFKNQYSSEVLVYKKPHPLPTGFFEDVSKFMDYLQENFPRYANTHRIVLRNKIEKLLNK